MNRNLKALLAAALALGAIAMIGASAQAAELFHCSEEPCRYTLKPDGTGKTAHHQFVIESKDTSESVSFTCPQLSGEARTINKTSSELTLTNLNYEGECKFLGSTPFVAFMNGCDYHISAAGQFTISCPGEEVIEIEIVETGCIFTIGPQAPVNGATYTNLGVQPNRQITMSWSFHGVAVVAHGTKAQCQIDPTETLELTYTTGNTIVTAESEDGVMADGWWL